MEDEVPRELPAASVPADPDREKYLGRFDRALCRVCHPDAA
jgi:hypothetical protein